MATTLVSTGITFPDATTQTTKSVDTVYTHPNHSGDVTSTADGATVIANGAVTDAKIGTMSSSKLTGALPAIDGSALTNLSAGKVLQVVSTTKTDTFSTTVQDNTFAALTGLSVSITPSATSSKVLIFVNIGKVSVGTNTDGMVTNFRIKRDSTSIAKGDDGGNSNLLCAFSTTSSSADDALSASHNYLDSPSSTSLIAYSIDMSGTNGSAHAINYRADGGTTSDAPQARTSCTITVMEIGA